MILACNKNEIVSIPVSPSQGENYLIGNPDASIALEVLGEEGGPFLLVGDSRSREALLL